MEFLPFLIALIIAITVHEFSHAWTAQYFGDPTARIMGRVSLNPLAHLDPIGTLMLFIVGIGWGKPVPVNPENFDKPLRYSALTSLAGPASNIIIALALAIPIRYMGHIMSDTALKLVETIFDINILLAVFNFIPLPPLDGSKMLGIFIPEKFSRGYNLFLRYGQYGFIIFLLVDVFVLQPMGFSVLAGTIGKLHTLIRSTILMNT